MTAIGRPRRITPERIVDAGIRLTLPRVTVRAMAQQLGVSETSVYRAAGDLDGLRAMVADGIIARRPTLLPASSDPEDALVELAHALRDFVIENPGIGYHLTHLDASAHRGALASIERSQTAFAETFGWEPGAASMIVSTVAEHAVALGELHPRSHREVHAPNPDSLPSPTIRAGVARSAAMSPRERFSWSIRATARGVLQLALGDAAHPAG